MRRGIGATALIAGLALAATACGSDSDDARSGADGKIEGTVTYWDTSNDGEKATYRKIAEDFEKKHPKVDVKYVHVNFGDANQKFKNAAGGNSGAPDVMRTEVAWVADFANLGYLAPLDGTPALDNASDYLETAAGSTRFDGKTYAVPQVTDTLGLFYNKRLLKKAGVEVPTSFAELKKNAAKIKDKTGATALYLRGDDPYWFLPYLYGEGGDLIDPEHKKVTVDEKPGVRALATMKDLVDSKAAVTDSSDGQENGIKAFQDGDVAMIIDGPWDIALAREGKEFKNGDKDTDNLGVAPVPAGSKAQGSPQGGWNLSVYAGTKNMRAAQEFAKYMSSAEVQARTTEELSLLPTRKSVYEKDAVKKNQMVKFFRPAVAKAVQRPWIAEGNSLFEPIRVGVDGVLAGGKSPAAAAEGTGDKFRKLLKGYH
ncbi:extracellular solute-binding protein [Streptomyces qinglanensis]|uniref:Arabinogalactan oligomer / maltooligosaccharide transport system substrate-binding protein n=1 Tax=Streptomyces qinglanensis TaxID=943816 RepID=A0A1H9NN13_9ACTN|nr:extracellular solute-binding protein [Streptomyces qinglanensis]SER37281.1 arabinogalactan oligomer / maltooligosaccharide transport system substrate-binding protein [Streptomyces qinglanensis]